MIVLRRPTADLTTTFGIAAVVSTVCGAALIITWHSPTWAGFGMLASAGATLIGVLERAPLPASDPTPVQTQGTDTVATKETT